MNNINVLKKLGLLLVFFFSIFLINACSTVGYYTQSIIGHSSIMLSRKPIDEVLKTAEPELKQKLLIAVDIRKFASTELGLPDNGSYTEFVELDSDTPIWNVIAAEEFSLKAKQWCYPIIGCASYRGYYHKKDAEHYAEELRKQRLEVHLAGATAYSTLGWFDDPLTSAMFKRGDASLAELIFHELAHQVVYIKGDSRFNEAFASAVGEQGAIRWMQLTNRTEMLEEYRQRLSVRDDFIVLINTAKERLQEIYESESSLAEKKQKKQMVFEQMRQEHQRLIVDKWGGKKWYSRWFSEPINNARLVSIATYRDLVPEFLLLFNRCENNFPRFYEKVRQISESEGRDLHVSCD